MPASTLGILILVQKCTMVIGGTFGIGRGSAIDLACAGANVVVTSRFVDAVHDVAGENEAIGRKGIPLTSDVLDRNSLQLLHESVGSSLGRVESGSNMGGLSHLTRSRPIVPARPRVVPLHSRLRWSGPAVAYAYAITPCIIPTELNLRILGASRKKELLLRTPMHRFGTAVYLASDASSFTTDQIIRVDGGFSGSGVNQ